MKFNILSEFLSSSNCSQIGMWAKLKRHWLVNSMFDLCFNFIFLTSHENLPFIIRVINLTKNIKKMLQPRIELGPKRWQRSILPLNYCSLTVLHKSSSITCTLLSYESIFLFVNNWLLSYALIFHNLLSLNFSFKL